MRSITSTKGRLLKRRGFTIVELLIVIVVIAILAAISIVAYNGIQQRAQVSRRESDASNYLKAIQAARINSGKVLQGVTGSFWSAGACSVSSGNTGNAEPKDLPKTHICWVTYNDNLDKISAASGVDLSGLRNGDARGNPYIIDENEGEQCAPDYLYYFTGTGAAYSILRVIPRTANC